ncbi:hypothetical protein [Parasphingorhabdus sp.]|uniref:hypothetical protein n=1 Tax=Parasphingorhabdus sp. TaxID=2709688 RepID=UPI00326340B7
MSLSMTWLGLTAVNGPEVEAVLASTGPETPFANPARHAQARSNRMLTWIMSSSSPKIQSDVIPTKPGILQTCFRNNQLSELHHEKQHARLPMRNRLDERHKSYATEGRRSPGI